MKSSTAVEKRAGAAWGKEDQIWLSPMLSRAFDCAESIVIHKSTEQIQNGPRCNSK